MTAPDRRAMVDRDDPSLPVVAQCRLLKLRAQRCITGRRRLTPMIWC